MDNTVHIDAALDRFSDTFDTFTAHPVDLSLGNHRAYRILQLRWTEFGLLLMLDQARSTIRLIDLYQKDDDDES